ncbi:MAG: Rne/Rng family ribonuclease [Pseudomonadota bacterium]
MSHKPTSQLNTKLEWHFSQSALETMAGLWRGTVLQELHIERLTTRSLVGNVYWAKITRVLPGLGAAFVDMGCVQGSPMVGFLQLQEVIDLKTLQRPEKITDVLREGQQLLVQVMKDPVGDKGPKVSMQVALAGRYAVFSPHRTEHGLSQKITDPQVRAQLLDWCARSPAGAYIMRTAAQGVDEATWKRSVAALHARWEEIQDAIPNLNGPACVYQEPNLALRLFRDSVLSDMHRVVVDDAALYAALQDYAVTESPELSSKLVLLSGAERLVARRALWAAGRAITTPEVTLPSGGKIVLQKTEALWVIDVNTGAFVGKRQVGATLLKTNLEAATALAAQIRLRNCAGVIVVDFIDMEHAEDRETLMTHLTQAVRSDPQKVQVYPMTELGLVQLVRRRVREPLDAALMDSCAHCQGRGLVTAPEAVCYELLHTIAEEQESEPEPPKSYRVRVHPTTYVWIQRHLNELQKAAQQRWQVTLTFVADPQCRIDDTVLLYG